MVRLSCSLLVAVLCSNAAAASALDRSRSRRARLELAFDHGYGTSTEGDYAELAVDFRLWAPYGLGAALRTGFATNGFSHALAADLGVAYRFDLVAQEHLGLQLAGTLGPSIARGPFDEGNVVAYGAFAMIHLDFWYRNVVVGIGVSAHAMSSERHQQSGGREAPILTLVPMMRIGGDWGL